MLHQKKIITTLALIGIISFCVAAVKNPEKKKRNLKVLPKDISDAKLDSIMHSYNTALGVSCNFCHSSVANFPDSLDFASDTQPMKGNARKMMQMVIEVNKKYFWYDKNIQPVFLNAVVCKTCHRGEAFPPLD